MAGYTDCPGCDFANRPETCHAITARNKRYCQLIEAGRCDYRGLVWDRTTADARPFECPQEPGPTPPPKFIAPVPVQPAPPIPVAISLAVMKCSAKGANFPCGCQQAKWYCGESFDLTTFPECVQCQSNQGGSHDPV